MNDEGQGTPRAALIFTVPVLGFVVALNLDPINKANPAALSDKTSDGSARPHPDNPARKGTENYANS
jgi:hypothetical protein